MNLNVEGYKDVTWREYREYSRVLEEIAPENEDERGALSTQDMGLLMICAAIMSGWAIGMEVPDAKTKEQRIVYYHDFSKHIDEQPVGIVLNMLDDFWDFQSRLRNPDPN